MANWNVVRARLAAGGTDTSAALRTVLAAVRRAKGSLELAAAELGTTKWSLQRVLSARDGAYPPEVARAIREVQDAFGSRQVRRVRTRGLELRKVEGNEWTE